MTVDIDKILENGKGESACSVCGSPVVHYSADEGTQSYIPLFTRKDATAMAEEILALRNELRAAKEGNLAIFGVLRMARVALNWYTDKFHIMDYCRQLTASTLEVENGVTDMAKAALTRIDAVLEGNK